MNTTRNTCVYTVMVGDDETLNEQPMAAASGMPFICLTDNPRLTSQSWRIVHVPTAFAMDPIRSQRLLKTCPHRVDALAGFEPTADTARAAMQAKRQALEQARQDIADLTGRLATTEQACADMTQRHAQAVVAMASAVAAMRASTSWRLTAPLRQLRTWLN